VTDLGCQGQLLFVGDNPAYIERYPDRYLPNLFPANNRDEITYWFRATRATTKHSKLIFPTNTTTASHKSGCGKLMFFSVGEARPVGEFVDHVLSRKCPKLLSRMMQRRRSAERLVLDPIPVAAVATSAHVVGAARAAAMERDPASSVRTGDFATSTLDQGAARAVVAERDAAAIAHAGANATNYKIIYTEPRTCALLVNTMRQIHLDFVIGNYSHNFCSI
jgi:hypothetical protein